MSATIESKSAPPTSAAGTVGAVMSHKQIMLVIYALMAGMFLSSLDQTIVGTAIRTIGDDLHGLDKQAWVTTAYLITSTIATPIYGKLSDIFGRRPLYVFAISVFVLGSLLSSFSTSMYMLAAFRAFQGIGAGGLMSLPLAIMGDMLAPRERAKYQGYFLAVFGVSAVIGPLVGGMFAGASTIAWIAGWRWVFLVNVPIGAAALAMVLTFLHLPRFEHHRVRVDWWGASAVVLTLVPLLLVAEQGRVWGWTSVTSIICYVLGVVGLVAFLVIETAMGRDAIIPLRLFHSRVFSMATVLGALVGFGMFGAMMTLPLYLQIVMGMSPTQSGFATLPMIGGLMVASIVSGQLISRTGKYRLFPVVGTALVAAGFFYLTFLTADSSYPFIAGAMVLIGLGLGQLMQSLVLASQNSVAPTDMGVATSSATFFRQIGGTLGTAILLSVLFASMPANIRSSMEDRAVLTDSLDAALTPAIAQAPENAGVMNKIWTPMVAPIKVNVQTQLDQVAAQATATAPDARTRELILQQVAAKSGASVVDGRLVIDYTDPAERQAVVDRVVPTISDQLASNSSTAGSSADSSTSDTSFLKGADPRLARPFLLGFTAAAIRIYWVGMGVLLLAFVLSWFFRVPELRQHSALQEQANRAAARTAASGADA
ncbi:drug resistance transporter, EmrB/QacA subfamily [Raineyella antarctica]|uniref:Drug resistance transporter, EmrB/QacA subfamily n=1 Tax=Raineyella antarctica TaxID=1577474 RepID=A0A1G6H2P9_9ACTN|nr:MDR family MFS transporter [Raineyella antarctica]SDB88542.1 drug resistance transporter, EmrB/QacA subfamily [Raineyella antarctica]